MTVEQLFRDGKSKRNGWGLRGTRVTTPERFDRLLLVLAVAYLLLCGVGLVAKQRFRPSAWCSTLQPIHDRAGHAGPGGRHPGGGVRGRDGAFGIGGTKLPMTQAN